MATPEPISESIHPAIPKSVSDLARGANPIRGKGLRVHWKKQTTLLPEMGLGAVHILRNTG